MTRAVSRVKFAASPAVLFPKSRVTGSSSLPPFRRLARVAAKSAALKAADVPNRTRFSLSQKLCLRGASDRIVLANGDGSTVATESNGPELVRDASCAKTAQHKATAGTKPFVARRSVAEKQVERISSRVRRPCQPASSSNHRNPQPRQRCPRLALNNAD